MDFVNALIYFDPLTIIRTGGYIGIAILIFAESGILLGIFFPGDSLLFTAGVLASAGFFHIIPLILLVIVSAILGDSVGYWFGRRMGEHFFTKKDSFFFKHSYLKRTKVFYTRYGNHAVIIARFVPIVRTIAPILAGVGTMSYRAFLSSNIIGGILWGTILTALGYLLGASIPDIAKYILPLTIGIIILSLLPILWHIIREKISLKTGKDNPTDRAT